MKGACGPYNLGGSATSMLALTTVSYIRAPSMRAWRVIHTVAQVETRGMSGDEGASGWIEEEGHQEE
jgi:hypothetical protein